ncbi:MAG: alkaline phosphatase family protein [Gemmatimonadota bacterium]|nr:alkaline phosphatase family protein [Gemmatimonadota bacterium]
MHQPGAAVTKKLQLPFVVSAFIAVVSLLSAAPAVRAQAPAENVVLIVTDGLRWQELFTGADSMLLSRRMGGIGDTAKYKREFWRPTATERRRIIMPFFWDSIAAKGIVWGNPGLGSNAMITNGKKFSYPGYNEMLAGAADPRINKNDFGPNPNTTVFEWLAAKPAFAAKVSAFATWGVFNEIFNAKRAGHLVFAGWEPPSMASIGTPDPSLDRSYRTTTRIWDNNTLDAPMQAALLNHVKAKKPRVLFVGYGETDEWAHLRRYDLMLRSAQSVDAFIAELWHSMQAMPEYRGRTTFIITTDHGRGELDAWTDHGEDVVGAERIWLAAFGAGVTARGEMRNANVTQAQIASTIASLLGEDFAKFHPRAARPFLQVR